MPGRRFNRRRRWRRRSRNPRRMGRRNRRNFRKPLIVDNANVVYMRWERSTRSTVTSNIVASSEFVANNINNIIGGSTNIQRPTGYDQWRQFYSLFEVISTTCSVKVTNFGNQPVNLALVPTVEPGTEFATFSQAAEQRFCKRIMVGPATGISNKQMTIKMNTRRIFGARPTETSPFVSPFGNNGPVKQWNYVLTAQNASELGVDGFDIIVKVVLTFAVRLHGRKVLFPITTQNKIGKVPIFDASKPISNDYMDIDMKDEETDSKSIMEPAFLSKRVKLWKK